MKRPEDYGWSETTEEIYNKKSCVLHRDVNSKGFLVAGVIGYGAAGFPLYEAYIISNGKFYTKTMDLVQFQMM